MGEEQNLMAERSGCVRFDAEVADYLEGEHRPLVYGHAQECAFCGAVLADLEQIRLASGQWPSQEPPARVWANVRAQLAQEGVFRERAPQWRRWFGESGLFAAPAPIAAVAALAICAALLLVHSRGFEGRLTSGSSPARPAEVATAQPYSADDANLTRTLGEMEESYEARKKALDPAVKVVYEKSLKSLDTSIDECRHSVKRDPNNELAHEYLLTAYAQKAEVLASALEFEGR